MSDEQMVTLVASDGEKFTVPFKVARLSRMIREAIGEDDEIEDEFPIPKINSSTLRLVVEYCTKYTETPMDSIDTPLKGDTIEEIVTPEWYAKWCKDMDRETVFNLVAAANYLDIKPLLDLTCLGVAVAIKGKSVDELRSIFNLPDPKSESSERNEQGAKEDVTSADKDAAMDEQS